jgi:hypothetical protein
MSGETALVNLHIPAPATTINASGYVDEAKALIIDSPMMAEIAGQSLVSLKGMIDGVERERKAVINPINEAHAAVQTFFKRFSDPLAEAITITKGKFVAYQTEQQRIAAELQRKADIAAAAERARIAAEAAAVAEKARKEQEKLAAEAAAAYAAGDLAAAAKIEAKAEVKAEAVADKVADLQVQAATTVSTVIAPAVAKVSGVSKGKDNWQFQIDDASKIPREFLCPDEKKIGQYVKAMKDGAKIDGVRIFNNPSVAVRA